MEILHKIEVLKDTYLDEAELGRVLGKLLDVALQPASDALGAV